MTITMTRPDSQFDYEHQTVHRLTSDDDIGGWSPASPPPRADVLWLRPWGNDGVDYQERLQRFMDFEANWDSYGAPPFDYIVVERTKRLMNELLRAGVPVPNLIPAASGSIILEWWTETMRLEIDIDPMGDDSMYVEDPASGTSIEYTGLLSKIPDSYRKVLNDALVHLCFQI